MTEYSELVGLIRKIRSTPAGAPGRGFPRGSTGGAPSGTLSAKVPTREIHGEIAFDIGFVALGIGVLWIGQGAGSITWPRASFMINQLQWAEYGALLGAIGLILIWQGNR